MQVVSIEATRIASQQSRSNLLERSILGDLGDRYLGQHGVLGEGRGAHVVVDLLTLAREARRAVRHQALTLRQSDLGAEVGLVRAAELALSALGDVQRDHVIAYSIQAFDRSDQ